MNITVRMINDVTVVDVSGSLDTGTFEVASAEMSRIADKSNNKVLLNLEDLEFLSSAGLRVLLLTKKQLSAAGGSFKICKPTGMVKEVMEISGFSNFLNLHESENEALSAF